MKGIVCQILKGLFVTGWLCLGPQEAIATTVTTAAGFQSALSSATCGTIINLTAGRYNADQFTISSKSCSGNPIIIQPLNYAGSYGTGDTVYIESTAAPGSGANLGWTQCTAACGAPCGGMTNCSEIWWTSQFASGAPWSSNAMINAQRPDGSPTKYTDSPTNFVGQFSQYNLGGYGNGTTLLVRWGTGNTTSSADAPGGVNNPKPYVFYTGNGYGIITSNVVGLTIQGLNFRCSRRALIQMDSGSSEITIQDDKFSYSIDNTGNESDRPVTTDRTNNVTIQRNEFFCSLSEAVHIQARASDAQTTIHIENNYIHDIGNGTAACGSVVGNHAIGTSNAATLTLSSECGNSCGSGNYTGSTFKGNVINTIADLNGRNKGMIVENNSYGWEISNNIFKNVGKDCIKLDAAGAGGTDPHKVSNNSIFNNLFYRCGALGIQINNDGGTREINNNFIYNNTFFGSNTAIGFNSCAGCGVITGNLIRNNIMVNDSGGMALDWLATDSSNRFDHNIAYSVDGNPVLHWGSTYYSCTDIPAADIDGSGIKHNYCQDPLFYDRDSLNLWPAGLINNAQGTVLNSVAVDSGTSTGQPATHITGILNSVAAQHGLSFYSDSISQGGSAWDIGATESYVSYGKTPVGSVWTQFVPSGGCSGVSGLLGTTGGGIILETQKDPSVLCEGVSQPLTLTVGHIYNVFVRLENVMSAADLTCAGGPPVACTQPASYTDCSNENIDNWDLVASNATITQTNVPSSGISPRGSFNSNPHLVDPVLRTYTLVPTSASVTLKLQVPALAGYVACPDLAYIFSNIVVVP